MKSVHKGCLDEEPPGFDCVYKSRIVFYPFYINI